MKTKDFRKRLKALGCSIARQSGSHEMWVCPSGRTLPPVVTSQREVSRRVITSVLRVLREEGLTTDRGWRKVA